MDDKKEGAQEKKTPFPCKVEPVVELTPLVCRVLSVDCVGGAKPPVGVVGLGDLTES